LLTAKLGKTTINTFDNGYDRYMLKKWSNKNILKCPVCSGIYEYCHGEYVSPYFRHKDKNCSGYFTEPETEEHKKGKQLLYEWVNNQKGIANIELECWLPETKQRPDIYFEKDGRKYVIEFQCSPVASEYKERRELYRLAGIKDIWVLGTEKYKIGFGGNGDVYHDKRYKSIEKDLQEKDGVVYLDIENKLFISNSKTLNIGKEFEKAIVKIQDDIDKITFRLFDKYWLDKDFLFAEFINNFELGSNGVVLGGSVKDKFDDLRSYYTKQYEKTIKEEKIRKQKEDQLKQKIKNIENTSQHVGIIDEPITKNVLLADKKFFWTYNSYLYKFIDENGDILTWFTSTRPSVRKGECVELTGKVKRHEEYEGTKQTRVIRCKIDSVKGDDVNIADQSVTNF